MKRLLYIIPFVLLLTACHEGRTYFPKDVESMESRREIIRFDRDLMNVHEASVTHDIRVLYDKYPLFMPLWVEDILGIPSSDTSYLEQQLPF